MNHKLFLIQELMDQDVAYARVGDKGAANITLGGEVHTLVAFEEGEGRRWSRTDHYVLKDSEGRHWAVPYEQGLTESQDCQGFREHVHDHGNPIHVAAHEVRPIPVQTITWETVK